MDHIPIEVIHEIFIKLDFYSKLRCMRVCRFWRETLDRRSLLHSIDIRTSDYPKFKDMMERHSYRGPQV